VRGQGEEEPGAIYMGPAYLYCSLFSDHNDIIFCDKSHTKRTLS
jgi:hypothetical protein